MPLYKRHYTKRTLDLFRQTVPRALKTLFHIKKSLRINDDPQALFRKTLNSLSDQVSDYISSFI